MTKKTSHVTAKSVIAKLNAGMSEEKIQGALIRWCRLNPNRLEGLTELMHHCPNQGTRSAGRGGKHNRLGVVAGIPDLHLPVARGGFHGLYLEMKTAKGHIRPEQTAMMERLKEQGHAVYVVRSRDEGITIIQEYYGGV